MIIDCRVAMYKEDPIRILGILDTQNDQLNVSNILPYHPPKDPFLGKTPKQINEIKNLLKNSVIAVDNADAFSDWDLVFKEHEHLDEAVQAYYMLKSGKILRLNDQVERQYSPESVIQVRKMDLKGNVYELDSENVNNGVMAVLIACWAAVKMRNTAGLSEESEITEDDQNDFLIPFSI